jgi:RNA polymerase sigma-70 factor (ECF subfamily)
VLGRTRVAKFVATFAGKFWPGTKTAWVEANGRAGILVSRADAALALLTISVSDEGIEQLMWIMNPSKLTAFARSLAGARRPA